MVIMERVDNNSFINQRQNRPIGRAIGMLEKTVNTKHTAQN